MKNRHSVEQIVAKLRRAQRSGASPSSEDRLE